MHTLDAVLTRIENVLAATALGLATLIAIVAVLLRFLFGTFIFWSEEAIIYLVIYSTFLGAVITLRHNEHVNVDIVGVFLRVGGKRAMAVLGATVTVVYFAVIGFYAWLLLLEPFSTSTSTPALDLPLWVVELAVPLGFTLMFLRAVEILWRAARGHAPRAEGQHSVLQTEAAAVGLDLSKDNALYTDVAPTGTAPGLEPPRRDTAGRADDDDTEQGR